MHTWTSPPDRACTGVNMYLLSYASVLGNHKLLSKCHVFKQDALWKNILTTTIWQFEQKSQRASKCSAFLLAYFTKGFHLTLLLL